MAVISHVFLSAKGEKGPSLNLSSYLRRFYVPRNQMKQSMNAFATLRDKCFYMGYLFTLFKVCYVTLPKCLLRLKLGFKQLRKKDENKLIKLLYQNLTFLYLFIKTQPKVRFSPFYSHSCLVSKVKSTHGNLSTEKFSLLLSPVQLDSQMPKPANTTLSITSSKFALIKPNLVDSDFWNTYACFFSITYIN